MKNKIKEMLHVHHRSLRTFPGMLLLGPTGARLWADALEPAPGFWGNLDFIHKMNLPLLFTVEAEGMPRKLEPMEADWYPDELAQRFENTDVRFYERKLITWEDVAVSYQRWENTGVDTLRLTLCMPEGMRMGRVYAFPEDAHGVRPLALMGSTAHWEDGALYLAPGARVEFLLAAAVGLPEEDALEAQLTQVLDTKKSPREVMDALCEAYLRWFDHVPAFSCDDPMTERCWWYRYYILRNSLARPGLGNLKGYVFYEGRSHRIKKAPAKPGGWEFSRLIPLSTPLTMADAQWLHGMGEVLGDSFRALVDSINKDGVFSVTSVDSHTKEYATYAPWALYRYYLVSGDRELVREVLPGFKTHVRNVHRLHNSGLDSLQVCQIHALTGKEYQPSYWYFAPNGYPRKVRPAEEGYTPLRRVDCSVYLYLNALGMAELCAATGDADSGEFQALACQIREDVLAKMWDGQSGYFYDLHAAREQMALVKSVVGIYPLWAGITGEEHLRALDILTDPAYFARGSAFASTGADCAVYSPSGGWMGDYIKGRDGCMWNGPSWPYTTAIALDTLGKQSKTHRHRYDRDFRRFLHEYTLEHFHQGDMEAPYLVEFYNSETGEPLSDEPDYNHSFYTDLIVRHVAGVDVTKQGISFCPLDTGMKYFSLEGLFIRGHRLDLFYQSREQLRYPEKPAGYTLEIDGKPAFSGIKRPEQPVEIAL